MLELIEYIIASMTISDTLHRSAFFQAAATVLCVLAVLVAHVGGIRSYSNSSRYVCPTFSCGELRDVSYPFRRREDPDGCGVPSYELSCSDTKATIQMNTGTYYVVDINYTGSSFVAVDASLDMQSSCPLPRWDHVPYVYGLWASPLDAHVMELSLAPEVAWANFVNCSKAVRNNHMYRKVECLSTNSSYVYVHTKGDLLFAVQDLEASCGNLALIPFGGVGGQIAPVNVGSADAVMRFMRHGFAVRFPYHYGQTTQRTWQEFFYDDIHYFIR